MKEDIELRVARVKQAILEIRNNPKEMVKVERLFAIESKGVK